MKKKILALFLSLTVLFASRSCKNEDFPKKTITTVLTGNIVDRDSSKALYLVEKTGDFQTTHIKIPISNRKFNYTLTAKYLQHYHLAFAEEIESNQGYMSIDFFNDADTVTFELYPFEISEQNKISGGSLNSIRNDVRRETNVFWNQIYDTYDQMDYLEITKKWLTKEVYAIKAKYYATENLIEKAELNRKIEKIRSEDRYISPEGKRLENQIDSLLKTIEDWELDWIQKENSLVGYSMLFEKFEVFNLNHPERLWELKDPFELYMKTHPKHPYTEIAKIKLQATSSIKLNGTYIDFKSNRNEDQLVLTSSTVADNKYTLIDLWAPWCASCIEKDRQLQPAYEQLKSKGLEVHAVLGSIKDKEQFLKESEKYKYPWNLNYELNHEFNIWDKYNIRRSGGSQFLVNQKGTILAINPTVQEIDSILNAMEP